MAAIKMTVSVADRAVTEHYASGEHARAFQRAMIAQCLPAYVARLGEVPVYTMEGQPANGAAVIATAERKARLEARRIAAEITRAASKAERMATAATLSAGYNTADGREGPDGLPAQYAGEDYDDMVANGATFH